MNWIVITIGTALVLALFAALLGPLFVDWTAYRSTIEAHAESLLGTHVDIDGEAELRLLPSPRIRLTDVRLGGADRPILTTRAVELDVDLAPLLRGEFHVLELRLDAPHATLTLEDDGKLAVPDIATDRRFASFFNVDNVTVENVTVAGGALTVRDRRLGSESTITDIAMTGAARTLRGPFSAGGTARIGGMQQQIQIAGGTVEAGTMPLSVDLTPVGSDIAVTFEGAAVPRPDALAMRGNLSVTATGRKAWSVQGELRASTGAVTLSRGQVRYGAGDAAITVGVDGRYSLGEHEPLILALAARQLDLDRLVRALTADTDGADAPAARPVREWAGLVAAHLAPALDALDTHGGLDIPVAATLDVGTIVAGGAIVRDVSAAFATTPDGLAIERAEALLPGDTTVELNGTLGDIFAGGVEVSASQPALLARWLTGAPLAIGTMAPVYVAADLEAGAKVLDARRLSLRIGDSSATGRTSYRWGGDEAPLLDVALAARRLAVADLANAWSVLGAADLGIATAPAILLDLSADEVRFGDSEGAAFNLDATYRDGTLTIDALGAQDIAGAQLFASGAIGDLLGTPVGAIDGTLVAADGVRLGSAIASVAGDNEMLGALARATPALAPADVRFSLSGGSGAGSAESLELSVVGTAAGTTLDSGVSLAPGPDWRERPARVHLFADNADGADLLAQFGLVVARPQPAASVNIAFAGTPARGMSGTADVTALGLAARFEGDVRVTDNLMPSGALSLTAVDLRPLGAAFARVLPDIAPVDLRAIVSGDTTGIDLDALEGTIAGQPVTGALALADPGLSGTLSVQTLDLGALAGLVLGREALAEVDGERWPTTVFTAPLAVDLPVDLALSADRLALGTLTLDNASLDLALTSRRIEISDLGATFAGGALTGDAALSREGTRADLSGTLALADADLGALMWQDDGAPVATGRLSLAGSFASSGYALSGLVAGLSGEGTMDVADGRIRALNPVPFDLASLTSAERDLPGEAEMRDLLARHLAAGDLAFDRLDAQLRLDGGTLRLADVAIEPDVAPSLGAAAIDLANWTVSSDWALALTPAAEDQLAAGLSFSGPVAAPGRQIDVAGLVAWLNLRQLERQVRTVERQNKELQAEAERYAPTLPADEAVPDGDPASPGAPPPQVGAPPLPPADPLQQPLDGEPGPAPATPPGGADAAPSAGTPPPAEGSAVPPPSPDASADPPATPAQPAPDAADLPPIPQPAPGGGAGGRDGDAEDAAPAPPADQQGALPAVRTLADTGATRREAA